jgi:hypothetical protein
MEMKTKSGSMVQSSIGKRRLDITGSAVGAARMNPADGYGTISLLLKEYIDKGSEKAWKEIRQRIDNVYVTVSSAMETLDGEAPFSGDVKKLVKSGKKLFFKPNHVMLPLIDYQTRGPGMPGVCTPWEFAAAVMRWFHDKQGITYHQMSAGEAGTTTTQGALLASRLSGGTVTTEAVLEGKYGNNYGGWGFYFTRKYLAECHDPKHTDDPMSGYQESLAGVCLPPGKAPDKLIVYDLNKVNDANSREIPVADGVNFKAITMHKAIVGGDPNDPQDLRDWPGCVLVNLPKLKIHNAELFTCAIKNLGMGLYAMEANTSREPGKYEWKYSIPNLKTPAVKMKVPHTRWSLEADEDTFMPLRDKKGNYIWKKTGGMEATMADAIQAVRGQNIMMLHVVDAIEASNISHIGAACALVPEGFVFVGTDPVALDECCARYLFTMVPLAEVDEVRKKHNLTSDVIQKIPMPGLEGKNIVTSDGYDSSFSRYNALKYCEKRGLGQRRYYVVGNDLRQGGRLASLRQHLGHLDGGVFSELITTTMYYASMKPLYDLQAAIFAYLELNDKLTGSDHKRQVLEAFDENGDGVIDYLEKGRGGSPAMMFYDMSLMNQKIEPAEAMKLRFLLSAVQFKLSRKEWNVDSHNLGETMVLGQALARAWAMSQAKEEKPDPLFPARTWGKGKWPSLQYVLQLQLLAQVYGQMFPGRFDVMMSPYGQAFNYADTRWNGAKYGNAQAISRNEDVIGDYHKAVARGDALLPFTLYVPRGLGSYGGVRIPNVEETDDPKLILTASFPGNEVWRELRLSSFHLQ